MNYIKDILSYVDKPWKIGAVLLLGLFGFVGWIFYEKRNEFINEWLLPKREHIELNIKEVKSGLVKLNEDTNADLIHIWWVDLSINSSRFLDGMRKDGKLITMSYPKRIPAVTAESDIRVVLNSIIGYHTCKDINGNIIGGGDSMGGLIRRLFIEQGMVRLCLVPVPPSPEALVGIIYLAWKVKQEETIEDAALSAAREVSLNMIKLGR